MSTLNPNQVNTTIFGMASAVFTSACATIVTLAVRSNEFIDKSMSTAIHGVSAAENVSKAVEERSAIYGRGIVNNGELSEREQALKYKIRLANLERQEERARAGELAPEASFADKMAEAITTVKNSVAGSADEAASGEPTIRNAVPLR